MTQSWESIRTVVSEAVGPLREDIKEIKSEIMGRDGLNTRVDRLEQVENRRHWWVTTAVVVSMAALASAAKSFFIHPR